jgi:hypothetical protein
MAGRMSLRLIVVCRWAFFRLILHEDGRRMPYVPPCSNQTESSRHHVAQDAARGFKASDRAGEGHSQQDDPPIDCRV